MRYARLAALGFALTLLSALGITVFSLHSMRRVVEMEDAARERARVLVEVERLRYLLAQKSASNRAYLLTGQASFRESMRARHEDFLALHRRLLEGTRTEEGRALLSRVAELAERHQEASERAGALVESTRSPRDELAVFLRDIQPVRDALHGTLDAYAAHVSAEQARDVAVVKDAVAGRRWMVGVISGVLLAFGVVLATSLTLHIARRDAAERRLAEEVIRQGRETEEAFVQLRAERDAAARAAAGLQQRSG
jgi:CHASE3 domain sensor protein